MNAHVTSFGKTLKKNMKNLNNSSENQAGRKTMKKKLEISTSLKIQDPLEPMEIFEEFNQREDFHDDISKDSLAEFEKVFVSLKI